MQANRVYEDDDADNENWCVHTVILHLSHSCPVTGKLLDQVRTLDWDQSLLFDMHKLCNS